MRDVAESMGSQVETQTPEDMAKKFVRDSSAHAGLEGWYDEGNNTDHHNSGRSCNSEEVNESFSC